MVGAFDPPDGEIIGHEWDDANGGTCALIRDRVTGAVGIYGIDVISRRPRLIKTVVQGDPPSTLPRGGPMQRKSRPRESKEWRARRKWEER